MAELTTRRRIALLDEIRGFCVFCMIFYHAFAFAGDAFSSSLGTTLYRFFAPAEPWYAGVFILICGISCRLSRSNWKRGGKLLLIAILITIITAFGLPRIGLSGMPIWFGILHMLAISILLFALLRKPLTKIPPMVGIVIFAILLLLFRNWCNRTSNLGGEFGLWGPLVWHMPDSWHQAFFLFPLGIKHIHFYSADYFPLIPYIFLFLIGTYLGVYVEEGRVPEWAYPERIKPFDWLGRHALLIYVIHMPVIFLILLLINFIGGRLI